jgi:molybdopterin-guanine dinucleotide biosynthesis protein A
MKTLGVVMAGGRNTRYGGLKAFAEVSGRRIVDRVIGALREATDDVVIIANDASAYASLGLPIRSDETSDGAALAGLLTALHWSRERKCGGVVTVACDMPFAPAALLSRLIAFAQKHGADIVAPESGSRRGVEPLCAYYANACIAPIEHAIARNDLRMIGFYDDVASMPLPIDEVRTFGDPDVLFLNVNTPEELIRAEQIARDNGL